MTSVVDYRSSLVPGRDCGGCVACCTVPAIDTEEFYKSVGVACRHCTAGNGCAIYDSRPQICRAYHCVWRSMPGLDESWRPDLSGVMIVWDRPGPGLDAEHGVDIVVVGDPALIESDRFLGLVGGFIAKGVSTMLSLPRGAGHLHTSLVINDLLRPAVAARDRGQARAILCAVRAEMMKRLPVPEPAR